MRYPLLGGVGESFFQKFFADSESLLIFALLNLNKLYYGTQTKRKKRYWHLSCDA